MRNRCRRVWTIMGASRRLWASLRRPPDWYHCSRRLGGLKPLEMNVTDQRKAEGESQRATDDFTRRRWMCSRTVKGTCFWVSTRNFTQYPWTTNEASLPEQEPSTRVNGCFTRNYNGRYSKWLGTNLSATQELIADSTAKAAYLFLPRFHLSLDGAPWYTNS